MTKYIGKTGQCVGQADDTVSIIASSITEAMQKLLGYSADQWPKSDCDYDAVCWIEDAEGNVLDVEHVEIGADGVRL
jgi:hypothetical protein